jgi:hypothetical protein
MRPISLLGVCSMLLPFKASFNVKDTEFEGTPTNIKGVLIPIKIDQDGAFLSHSLLHFYDKWFTECTL